MHLMGGYHVLRGRGSKAPLGPSWHGEWVNLALWAPHSQHVQLILYPTLESKPLVISLDEAEHRSGPIWHIALRDLPPKTRYGYRVDHQPDLLLDPYARQLEAPEVWGQQGPYLGLLDHPLPFDWAGDVPPRHPTENLILYEMHVRGWTQSPYAHVNHPGTFLGVIEKIDYLKSLGINAIELMPLFEFREWDCPFTNPQTGEKLYNYWGYAPISFFAPMRRYGTITDFKTMVRALHRAGIEVILDVVYNHTGEGELGDPPLSWRGLDNAHYYLMTPDGRYANYSGCGNTFNANTQEGKHLILTSLRYWVDEMHVDGFRFDLASILTRGPQGEVLPHPPLLQAIAQDPVLSQVRLIAEAWDATGLYQLGLFPQWGPWSEWNGRYRDAVRHFLKGGGGVGALATRWCGSQDLYHAYSPLCSINFVTAHDGFTLHDLVSYNSKHNLANGEHNRDGDNGHNSWNCGVEGESDREDVLELRRRQVRNFLLMLLTAQGIPMLSMGDEVGHTKCGNNNSWCHDSPLNWFPWERWQANQELFVFCRTLIALRQRFAALRSTRFFDAPDITFHGLTPQHPNWDPGSHLLGWTLHDPTQPLAFCFFFNAQLQAQRITLPPPPHGPWHTVVATQEAAIHLPPRSHPEETLSLIPYSAYLLFSGPLACWDQL